MYLKIMKENKNATFYILSMALSSMAVGIFSLVFNLHISQIIHEKIFLSNFFLIGNISMAIGGIFVGRIIDKYNKRNVLIVGTFGAAFFFAVECLLRSVVVLYCASLFYGLIFSLLMSIHTPFLMCYVDEKTQPYVLSIATSIKIACYTIGTILAGYIPNIAILNINTKSDYYTPLFLAIILYFLSVFPLFGIEREYEYRLKEDNKNILQEQKQSNELKVFDFGFILPFFLLGLLIFFSPYINLYFQNRYNMELKHISIVLVLVELLPALMNILLMNLCKHFSIENIVLFGCMGSMIVYGLLAIFNYPVVQILLLLIATIISSFIFPQISRLIIKKVDKNKMGTISGFANAFYNAGDAAGNYLEGLCIANGIYRFPFILASIIYLLFVIIMKLNLKRVR